MNVVSPAPQRVRISWELLTLPDDCGDKPDERNEGFWPSLDPDSPGYIGDESQCQSEGTTQAERFAYQKGVAEQRMQEWEWGHWGYVGVIARAQIFIPIGGSSFRTMQIDSAGLWGIESDSGDYIREVFGQEREQLLTELRTLCAALGSEPSFDEELPE